MAERDRQITSQMLQYYHERRDAGDPDLDFLPFIKSDPNAYLLGVVYNQGMSADITWQIPERLNDRLGHFDINKIANSDIETLEGAFEQKPTLHRYWRTMASHTKNVAQLLVDKYEGSADNVWNDNPTVEILYDRLSEFKGIGPKKANMALRALALFFKVPIRNLEDIDIPVDVHVRRIFQRTGFSGSDSMEDIVEAARRVHPEFPAELDLPSWLIGRRWCHAQNPDCDNCVLVDNCRKIIYQSTDNDN